MTRPTTGSGEQALRDIEEAAYHAYREWPVFLVIRQKELEAHQAILQPEPARVWDDLPSANDLPDAVADVSRGQAARP